MFGFGKKREAAQLPPTAAYDLGETIGRCLFRAIAGYLDYRLSQLTVKMLTLLAERFETIHDEPKHKAEVVANVEFEIFCNNLKDFQPRLRSEIDATLSDWLQIASSSNQKSEVEDYISERLIEFHEDLLGQGSAMRSQMISNL
jgi:hypothetical protein